MKFLLCLTLLYPFAIWASACGVTGTIEERIKDCNSTKGDFILVHRTEDGHEIHKDQKTGLLWGDRISVDFNHYGSQKACALDELLKDETFKKVHWRLPTVREFEDAATHGMKESLPHMTHFFWTSTPVKTSRRYRRKNPNPVMAFLWDGQGEKSDTGDLKDAASVRCVGKL